ncbi:MAG TPA: hypothetical protein PLY87_28340, partial [Planctomycetaceae bacterium]|nr:hypothetical protein [Planctomycetaceae bacterium]
AYVDLNPIRAAMAETIEGSDFTSGQKRAGELRSKFSIESVEGSEKADSGKLEGSRPEDRPSYDAGEAPSSGLSATFSPDSGEKGHGKRSL